MWQSITSFFSGAPAPQPQTPAHAGDSNKTTEEEQEKVTPEVEEKEAVQNSFLVSCLTGDDKRVAVPSHILSYSKTFKNLCDNLAIGQDLEEGEEPSFPGDFLLGDIKEATFLKVIEWCKEHLGQPDPVVREDPKTFERIHFVYTPFEQKFLNVQVPELCELLLAASFLDIRSLYLYGCQKGALLMLNKSVERVRAEWGFEDDLTEEQKNQIRKEHSWFL